MNHVCEEMITIRLEGDIVPISWYENIRKGKDKGKPDLEACLILANILYWYRPTEIRDEITNNVTGYNQKFKADKLQKSYQQYSDFLGLPKKSVKRAFDNLVEHNLITREFRNYLTKDGLHLTNVMYVEPVMDNILGISYRKTVGDMQENRGGSYPKREGGIIEKGKEVLSKKGDTNTEITTEITTETTTRRYRAPSINHKITEEVLETFEKEYPGVDIKEEWEKCKDNWLARGKTMKDEQAAFRNWMRLTKEYGNATRRSDNRRHGGDDADINPFAGCKPIISQATT